MADSEKQEIISFFHEISPIILALAAEKFKKAKIVKYKGRDKDTLNFVTEADIACENVIVAEIKKRFPADGVVAEENYSNVKVGQHGRFWIIDPICGTSNFAKELKLFVSNIALAEDGKLVAGCAVDHSQGEYIWSVGKGIFIGQKKADLGRKSSGRTIEVDLGAAMTGSRAIREQFARFVSKLVVETNYAPVSYNSSLGFSYAAIGRLDAYVSADNKVWDVAAPNFLIMVAGGVVTTFEGKPWTLESRSVVAAREKDFHKELISYLNS